MSEAEKAGRSGELDIDGYELLWEGPGVRASLLTLGPGQCVPWHRHSTVTDTFVSAEGTVRVEAREPDESFTLAVGESCRVPAGRPHEVTPADGKRCRFVLVQSGGAYDFVPES